MARSRRCSTVRPRFTAQRSHLSLALRTPIPFQCFCPLEVGRNTETGLERQLNGARLCLDQPAMSTEATAAADATSTTAVTSATAAAGAGGGVLAVWPASALPRRLPYTAAPPAASSSTTPTMVSAIWPLSQPVRSARSALTATARAVRVHDSDVRSPCNPGSRIWPSVASVIVDQS